MPNLYVALTLMRPATLLASWWSTEQQGHSIVTLTLKTENSMFLLLLYKFFPLRFPPQTFPAFLLRRMRIGRALVGSAFWSFRFGFPGFSVFQLRKRSFRLLLLLCRFSRCCDFPSAVRAPLRLPLSLLLCCFAVLLAMR